MRVPSWAWWIVAYATILPVAAGLGHVSSLGAGNAVFVAGALAILGSMFYIRLGGDRTVIARGLDGRPVRGLNEAARRKEIGTGLKLFLVGAALWAALGVSLWLE